MNGNEWVKKEGCDKVAAGNSRFCVHCGNPTTFYQDDLLKPWDEVQQANKKKALKETASTVDNDAPF